MDFLFFVISTQGEICSVILSETMCDPETCGELCFSIVSGSPTSAPLHSATEGQKEHWIASLRSQGQKNKKSFVHLFVFVYLFLSFLTMSPIQKPSRRSIGNAGEDIAVRYLESKGYTILERNYQIKGGEIDIIAVDGDITVFVEVRYRVNEDHGHPLDTFGMIKRRAMRRTLMLYVNKNKIDLENIRVDFIGIMPKSEGGHRVWHVRGVEM